MCQVEVGRPVDITAEFRTCSAPTFVSTVIVCGAWLGILMPCRTYAASLNWRPSSGVRNPGSASGCVYLLWQHDRRITSRQAFAGLWSAGVAAYDGGCALRIAERSIVADGRDRSMLRCKDAF